jgi:hypothetical protein
MAKIKHINVLSLGKILAVINAVLGLIQGLLVTIGSMMGVDMSQGQIPANSLVQQFAIVYFPVLYAVGGFVGGLLTAVIFNHAVKILGPLEVDIEGKLEDKN